MADTDSSDKTTNPLAPIMQSTNLPNTIRGRAQRVFLRFLAGSLAHPYVREVRQNLDDMDARSKINMMVAEELGRQVIADPDFMERARIRLLGEVAKKQQNLENILLLTDEIIQKIEDSNNNDDNECIPEPNEDWISAFTREAEIASSAELRDRLSRLLAGEICNPGSISRSTIRIVSEMDQVIIKHFQTILNYKFSDFIIIDDAWHSGDKFKIGILLEQSGLVSGTSGHITKSFVANEKGIAIMENESSGLLIQMKPNNTKQVPCWLITRAGLEISSLIEHPTINRQCEIAVERINKDGISKIFIAEKNDTTYSYNESAPCWPEGLVSRLADSKSKTFSFY